MNLGKGNLNLKNAKLAMCQQSSNRFEDGAREVRAVVVHVNSLASLKVKLHPSGQMRARIGIEFRKGTVNKGA
jgi:hypothetical protein